MATGSISERRYRRQDDVASEVVGDELLLVQLTRGAAFRLNRTGKAVWELAVAGLPVAEIAERLHPTFGVSREQLEQDAGALMEELTAGGLLAPCSEAA